MHTHQTRLKTSVIYMAFALLMCLGLTLPHHLEAKDAKDKTVVKQELKQTKNKKQVAAKAPETKAEEAKPVPAPAPAPAPKPAPVTPDKKKYGTPEGYQKMTDGRVVNFRSMGVIYMHGYKYSYYSSRVLYHYRTPEWYACDDHLYRTADGYIVVASRDHAQGSIVPTPFGPGKVFDVCQHSGVIDIYVNF